MLLGEGQIGSETGGVRIMKPQTARLAMSNLLTEGVATKGSMIDGQGFGAGGRVSLAGSPTGEGVYGWGGAAGTLGFVDRARGYRGGGSNQYITADVPSFPANFGGDLSKGGMSWVFWGGGVRG